MSNIYHQLGYSSRKAYLKSIATEYGVSLRTVLEVANIYGESEDFDGLLIALEDYNSLY